MQTLHTEKIHTEKIAKVFLRSLKLRFRTRLEYENSEAGVGLIEMLVALALLAIGLVSFIGVYSAVGRATKMAVDRQAAINIAAQQLSELEAFESISWNYSSSIPSNILNSIQTVGGIPYTATILVSDCPQQVQGQNVPSISAEVTVSWTFGTNTYKYSESTLLTTQGAFSCP